MRNFTWKGQFSTRFENFRHKKDLVLERTISIKVRQFYTPINLSLKYIPKVNKSIECAIWRENAAHAIRTFDFRPDDPANSYKIFRFKN